MWAANDMTKRNKKFLHLCARAGRNRTRQAGQSLVVAVIVLFLLLFLGGIFIALIANNLKNAQRSARVSAAGKFADAGVRFLDEQLTNSPDGADFRPVPDNITNTRDPDFFWLKPYDNGTGEGGYTRINFGGPTPATANTGGRALVRVTYNPDIVVAPAGSTNADITLRANGPNRTGKFIKIESIGRAGIVDPRDPTTFGNSERAGLRRELVAYKAIGLTDYLRYVTNRDNRPNPATLGAPYPVYERPENSTGDTVAPPVSRNIESLYLGPIRVNAPLTFYGVNRFRLTPERGDSIEVAGPISLNGVAPNATQADFTAANPRATQVFVNAALNATVATGNANLLLPSTSGAFTTFNGLALDNPRGSDTQGLVADAGNANLRSVGRQTPPLMDAPTGARGATRYRTLTRDSEPISPAFSSVNPVPAANVTFAGSYGWGSGLYIPNTGDVQKPSESVTGAVSARTEWLNPGLYGQSWQSDTQYAPPAVSITFTPRYIIIDRNATGGRTYLRRPDGGRINSSRIIRYTGQIPSKPAPGIGHTPPNDPVPYLGIADTTPRFEGYPAKKDADGIDRSGDEAYYSGDFVIYAEGNIRVKGTIGGMDPETQEYFSRHLTVVSGGTIYVDGNLLRDNITPALAQSDPRAQAVKGQSSIALLAKNYITVNTTQFLSPDAPVTGTVASETENGKPPFQFRLNETVRQFNFGFSVGPDEAYNPATGRADPTTTNREPLYVTGAVGAPNQYIYMRHQPVNKEGSAVVNLLVNSTAITTPNRFDFNNLFGAANGGLPLLARTSASKYYSDAFALNTAQLFPQNVFPFSGTLPSIGLENRLTINYDLSAPDNSSPYAFSRIGVVPRDIRIEALMYAQEGSFFIIPGPWFNPTSNDTYANFVDTTVNTPDLQRVRPGSSTGPERQGIDPRFPFYGEPLDTRITFYGAITENVTAEIGDQGAWVEKWGWTPRYYGITGLNVGRGAAGDTTLRPTYHGPNGVNPGPGGGGNGIVYIYDDRATSPYSNASGTYKPIRPNPTRPSEPLPLTPRLPVAPGLLYFGENPVR